MKHVSASRLLALVALLLCACTTPAPTYKYPSPAPTDPNISFESDFVLHTHFSVNNKAPDENRCADFDTAGYLLKEDSVFIYDKASYTLQVKTPASKPLAVSAYHSFGDGSYSVSCGPLTLMFTPEKAKEYFVKMNLEEKVCYMSVQSSDEVGKRVPVASKTLPKCAR
jgi:hypothetical protein